MLTIYFFVGAFVGVMSGLFGVGGGIIVIPALCTLYLHQGDIPQNNIMQMAVGTSLAIMIVTLSSALYAHHKRNSVRWTMVLLMLPGLMLGSVIGALTAHILSSVFLQIVFSIFLFVIGFRMVLNKKTHESSWSISVWIVRVISLFMGALSSLLGMGGGILLVPFFLRCKMDMSEVAGTSIACALSISIVATSSFMLTGLYSVNKVPWSTGYIYWPAFFGIAIASALFAPMGAILAHRLPRDFLKRIFGLFLLLMACDMLWQVLY
jgi:uncharacterized membrane protein YfcA